MHNAPSHPLLRLGAAPDDRQAWTAAVDAYAALCWRIALRMLGDQDRAGDAVQDTLLALRASARRFRPGTDLDASAVAWVARVAVNTCHTHRRRRSPAGPPDAGLAAPLADPADGEALAAVRAAVGELPAGLREAIELRYLAGLDGARLAEALGVAQGAARMRIHRGLDALRTILLRRGVCLSVVALVAVFDRAAEAAIPPPPPSLTTAWAQIPLPGLPTTMSTGAVVAMSAILASVAGTVLAVAVSAAQPEPAPAPRPGPAPIPAPAPEVVRVQAFADVEAALAWFAARQQADGSWLPGLSATAPATERTAATAAAMLAFLGAGFTPATHSPYQDAVRRGGTWLVGHPLAADVPLQDLAVRVQALCEGWVTVQPAGAWPGVEVAPETPENRQYRLAWEKATEEALARLLARRIGPGWPATAGGKLIDTHATALAVSALVSAKFAGLPAASAALEPLRAWAHRAWDRRVGAGFPAQTAEDAAPVGDAVDDISGLAVVARTCPSTEASAWSALATRALATERPDAGRALLLRSGAWWAEGKVWQSCHADRAATHVLAATEASAGHMADAAAAIQAMEVHVRWEKLFGAKGLDPIEPPASPLQTY